MKTFVTKEIYEDNLNAFKRAYPIEADKLEERSLKKSGHKFELVDNLSGGSSLRAVTSSGRKLMLQRIYGEEDFIKKKMEEYGRIIPHTPFFVIGSTHIKLVREFIKAAEDDCFIVVYEPSWEVFLEVMKMEDISDLLTDSPVLFVIEGLIKEPLHEIISKCFALDTLASFKQFTCPNYEILFPKEVMNAAKELSDGLCNLMTEWNTMERYTDVAGLNEIRNLKQYIKGYNIVSLFGILKHQIPAIVVSAGPSLNKNIKELKKAKNHACIIAVDTAIKPLLNNGIVPDLFCIVDGKKPTELMAHPGIDEVPLVTGVVVAEGIMELHKGKKFFYYCGEHLEDKIIQLTKKESGSNRNLTPMTLPSGGSVANNAFSLAYYMNPSRIIFVGQDLALTNGRTHADGTFKEKMDKLSDEQMKDAIEVEGIHGETVYTRNDFYRYLLWFETFIKDSKIEGCIDATEGGAKIHGTKNMTLKTAIKKYCTVDVSIKDMLEELPEMFDYTAKKAIKEMYDSLPDKMLEVSRKAHAGFNAYHEFGKLAMEENVDEKKLKKLGEKIGKINDYMNTDSYALFVQGSMASIERVMRTAIYDYEEDEVDERVAIAKEGRFYNAVIELYAKKWRKDLKKLIKERELTVCEEDIQGPIDRLIYELKEEENHGKD